jgi:3-oxoacyl-[acyl-carrier-protein] synthase II
MKRIVVTGIGIVSALGVGKKANWEAFLAGQDGSSEVEGFDTSRYQVHRACEIKSLPDDPHFSDLPPDLMVYKYAHLAAEEAYVESGAGESLPQSRRMGIAFGTLTGDLPLYEKELLKNPHDKAGGFNRLISSTYPPQAISARLANDFGMEGPNQVFLNACSSGNHAIAYAADLLREGRADLMLAGGGERIPITEFTHFHNLRALTAEKCRPFDKNRQGLMIGEGAAMMVLETMERAKRRGAPIYGEIKGYALSCDGFHMTAPHPEGDGAVSAIERTLSMARMNPDQVDYICAHGTGTPLNDVMETKAIKRVFGDRRIPVSSLKSMIGHTMGAASAIESAACCLALTEKVIPPTINYQTPDPDCDLDVVPNEARALNARNILNNSFAFGGNNVTILFSNPVN